jgi:hypothetical protein
VHDLEKEDRALEQMVVVEEEIPAQKVEEQFQEKDNVAGMEEGNEKS